VEHEDHVLAKIAAKDGMEPDFALNAYVTVLSLQLKLAVARMFQQKPKNGLTPVLDKALVEIG
jgi:hypothetical protein